MRVSAEKLKEDLVELLDEVLKTDIPIEIERKGHILKRKYAWSEVTN